MQQSLFSENNNTQKSKGLVIAKAGKKTLTKNQLEFNKLTQKIEKLQKEIEKKKLQFDAALKVYGTEIYPIQTEVSKQRRDLVLLLWDIYKSKKLAKADLRRLKEIVEHNLEIFIDEQESVQLDKAMQEVFEGIYNQSYSDMIAEGEAEAKKDLEQMLKSAKVDIDDLDINDPEAIARKVLEAHQKITEQEEKNFERQEKRNAKKKKSIKEIEYEKLQAAAEEMKGKNISTIYKQLAKLFHPDLEQDEVRKAEKVILMQELIAAYEAKNLHALLSLELKWIHNENNHLESLTEEKLAIYLQILKEQTKELETEKITIYQHPQYNSLVEKFGYAIARNPLQITLNYLKDLKDHSVGLERDLNDFQSPNALKYIKAIIKDWKNKENDTEDFDEEILRMLFGN